MTVLSRPSRTPWHRGRARRLRQEEHGNALIEFALTLPLFLIVFVGVVNFSLFLVQSIEIQEAASAGAIYGTIPGNGANTSGMTTAAQNSAPTIANLSVNASNVYMCTPGGAAVSQNSSCQSGKTPLRYVQVTTSATSSALFKFPGLSPSLHLSGFASLPIPWGP